MLALLLHFGALAVALGTATGLVVLNVVLWRASSVSLLLLIVTAAAAFLAVTATILTIALPATDPRLRGLTPVGPGPNGALIAFVAQVAAVVPVPAPDQIFVVPDAVAFARHETRLGGLLSKRRVLAIGLPLLTGLPADDLAAIIARELSHFAGGGRAASVTARTRDFIETVTGMADETAGGRLWLRFWAMPVAAYGYLFGAVTAGMARQRDEFALRRAAMVIGPERALQAFNAAGAINARHAKARRVFLDPSWAAGRAPDNVFELTRRIVLTDDEMSAAESADRSSGLRVLASATPDSSPPSFGASPIAGRLHDVAALERSMSAHVNATANTDRRLEPIMAGDIAATVLGARIAAEVAAMREVTSQGRRLGDGRDRLVTLLLTGDRQELAQLIGGPLLAYAYRRRQDDGELLPGASKILADLLVRERGCAWRTDWVNGVGVVDEHGEPVDLDVLACAALEGPHAAAAQFAKYSIAMPAGVTGASRSG